MPKRHPMQPKMTWVTRRQRGCILPTARHRKRGLITAASLLLGQALGQAEESTRLDQYTLAKGPVVIGGVSQNASGLTYHTGRDSLFVVLDSPQRIVEINLDGSLKRKISLN